MKANELRVGNLVYDDDDIIEVEAYQLYILTDYFEPIPLTEEWLERSGFSEEIKEVNHSDFWVYKKGDLTFNSNHGWWYMNQPLRHYPKYVHQIQNLYFALTGEELTLKE